MERLGQADNSAMITVADHLRLMTPAVRATVDAARRAVRAAAPAATENPYQSKPPRSKRAMWKIARYALADTDVVGIGAFSTHVHLYFYRGVELDDGSGLLVGGGKALRSVKLNTPLEAARPEVKRLLRRAFRLASEGGPDDFQAKPR
jgi:hypothetical protein